MLKRLSIREENKEKKCQSLWFHLNVSGLDLLVSCFFNHECHVLQNNCCVCFVLFFFPLDAILNMVNNIAANVLGSKPELEGEASTGGINP